MVDAYKSLGIEYIASMPGSSFRGLQESFINYGKNTAPEWLTTLHEEISVAMAHGYAKVEGKPMLNLVHATVGLQHASMAVYNAYSDRVPICLITANIADATLRRPGVEVDHTVQDGAVIVRDYTKWDDSPGGLQHFAEFDGTQLSDHDDAAAGADPYRRRQRAAGRPDSGRCEAVDSEAAALRAGGGRFRRCRRARKDARRGREPGDHG